MDKKLYREAERLLEKEIREITENGSLDTNSLDVMYKVLDNIKDITIICAMKREAEYSEYSERMYYEDDSYARGRDSRGRYSSRGSYDDSYGRSYSRGYSSEPDYSQMMSEAKSEKERELLRQLMEARQN